MRNSDLNLNLYAAAPQNLRRESEEVFVRLDPVKFLVRLLELLELHYKPPIFGGRD
jgi:hypothetical protein